MKKEGARAVRLALGSYISLLKTGEGFVFNTKVLQSVKQLQKQGEAFYPFKYLCID